MNEKLELLKEIIRTGIEKSIDRINKISSYKWEVSDISFKINPENEQSVCVYISVPSFNKILFLLFANKKDGDIIFRSLTGYSFPYANRITKVHELLISEIGNIVLNSALGELSNKIGKTIIPFSPKTINGEKKFLLENVSSMIEDNINKTVMSVIIDLRSIENVKLEVYFFFENSILELI